MNKYFKLLTTLLFLQLSSHAFPQDFSILSYNVENLFDTTHDENKEDFEYLPLSDSKKLEGCKREKNPYYRKNCIENDWIKEHYQSKLAQITKALLHSKEKIAIIGLAEIENEAVLNDLLKSLGSDFKGVISNSPDDRGIDVAIIYNEKIGEFVFTSSKEYQVEELLAHNKKSRNILVANFQLKNKKNLSIIMNHWPSQAAKTPARIATAKKMREIVQLLKKDSSEILMMGDFNVIAREEREIIQALGEEIIQLPLTSQFTKIDGTYFYKKDREWNLLDRFFIHSASSLIDRKSARIYNANELSNDYQSDKFKGPIPMPYDPKTKQGFSDHYPIILKVKTPALR